jgi:serine/threonine protein phosphatase 1
MKIGISAIEHAPFKKCITIDNNKRVFIIGDLDGDLYALIKAMNNVNFDPQSDHLFCLGDVIDRGEKSYELFHYLEEINSHMVLGNHDHLMLESIITKDTEALSIWEKNGGKWHSSIFENELLEMCQKLLTKPLSIILKYQGHNIGLSHTLSTTWDWNHYPADKTKIIESLLWNRDVVKKRKLLKNICVDFSIHGHNSTQVPFWISNSYHIDTNYYGRPTLLDLKSVIQRVNLRNINDT